MNLRRPAALAGPDPRCRGRLRGQALLALLGIVAACEGGGIFLASDNPSPAATSITAFPTQIKADGISTATIIVQLKNSSFQNLQQGGNAVQIVTSLGTLTPLTDHNNGTYSAILTSTTSQGTARVTGSVEAGMITTGDAFVAFVP